MFISNEDEWEAASRDWAAKLEARGVTPEIFQNASRVDSFVRRIAEEMATLCNTSLRPQLPKEKLERIAELSATNDPQFFIRRFVTNGSALKVLDVEQLLFLQRVQLGTWYNSADIVVAARTDEETAELNAIMRLIGDEAYRLYGEYQEALAERLGDKRKIDDEEIRDALGTRTYNVLEQANILYLCFLTELTEEELRGLRNFGWRCLERVKLVLKNAGLQLKEA